MVQSRKLGNSDIQFKVRLPLRKPWDEVIPASQRRPVILLPDFICCLIYAEVVKKPEQGLLIRRKIVVKAASRNNKKAEQIFAFTRRLRGKYPVPRTLKALAYDTAFTVPQASSRRCRPVKPLKGKGIPASRLLVMDRR